MRSSLREANLLMRCDMEWGIRSGEGGDSNASSADRGDHDASGVVRLPVQLSSHPEGRWRREARRGGPRASEAQSSRRAPERRAGQEDCLQPRLRYRVRRGVGGRSHCYPALHQTPRLFDHRAANGGPWFGVDGVPELDSDVHIAQGRDENLESCGKPLAVAFAAAPGKTAGSGSILPPGKVRTEPPPRRCLAAARATLERPPGVSATVIR